MHELFFAPIQLVPEDRLVCDERRCFVETVDGDLETEQVLVDLANVVWIGLRFAVFAYRLIAVVANNLLIMDACLVTLLSTRFAVHNSIGRIFYLAGSRSIFDLRSSTEFRC